MPGRTVALQARRCSTSRHVSYRRPSSSHVRHAAAFRACDIHATAREKHERAQHQTHSTCTPSSSIRPCRAVEPTAAELWPTHTA
eukprot:3705126-Prymnesium_polylepis.2